MQNAKGKMKSEPFIFPFALLIFGQLLLRED